MTPDEPATSPLVAEAIRLSRLAAVPADLLGRLLADAEFIEAPAGIVRWWLRETPPCGLLVIGVLRQFLMASDGREVTVRYLRPGDLLGAANASPASVAASGHMHIQTVTPVSGYQFNLDTLRDLARTEVSVAWALLEEVALAQRDLVRCVAGAAFGTVRQRVARHLLDLGCAEHLDPPYVAAVTHQQLAAAVGSTREVVGRALSELRATGLVETTRGGILLPDPAGLATEAVGVEP